MLMSAGPFIAGGLSVPAILSGQGNRICSDIELSPQKGVNAERQEDWLAARVRAGQDKQRE